jgi:hypothetical protein
LFEIIENLDLLIFICKKKKKELENEKLRLENEIISLSGRKEQYSAWLGERDKYHEELSKT